MLDGLLPLVSTRKVDVDIRPFAAFLGEEALKQQIHADRINGRDFEGVADGAVRGRPATLDQNVVLFAETDDVPNDQEIPGQCEFFDQCQFVRDLATRALVIRAIASPCAFVDRACLKSAHAAIQSGHCRYLSRMVCCERCRP
jgi:hypothetical protein